MTDDEVIAHLRSEYREGRRHGRVREPEWNALVRIAVLEKMAGLTILGTFAEYNPLGSDPMLIYGDHFSVRVNYRET